MIHIEKCSEKNKCSVFPPIHFRFFSSNWKFNMAGHTHTTIMLLSLIPLVVSKLIDCMYVCMCVYFKSLLTPVTAWTSLCRFFWQDVCHCLFLGLRGLRARGYPAWLMPKAALQLTVSQFIENVCLCSDVFSFPM